MALVKTAVLLFAAPGTGNLNLAHDRLWYDHYFFHPSYGQAGYWMDQTDGERVLHGNVFDWIVYPEPSPNFSNRTATANLVIQAFQDRGVNFDTFDIVVVVLGIAPTMQSDGGSTRARSENREHNAVVIRVGDPFDFVAHELGHALGLRHSFGTKLVARVGENPGGYGHLFCIMSARVYGETPASFVPAQPRDNAPEYSSLGPSLNGLTAHAHGWIDAHSMDIAATAQADFSIRSRQWLGRFPTGTPQGLEIVAPDGSNYFVDFYEPTDWDQAQPGPAIVLTRDKGGVAIIHYPTDHSGTYVNHIRLPLTFGAPGSSLQTGGFSITVLGYQPITHEVRIRVRRGSSNSPEVELNWNVATLASQRLESGVSSWERGEALCITGTWSYDKMGISQEAVIDATYALGGPGMTAAWSVEGKALPVTSTPSTGSLNVTMTVRVAHPKFVEVIETRTITLAYTIEPLSNGSRLKLRNRPVDESFKPRIEVVLSNSFGKGSAMTWLNFKGHEYVYEPAFYEARDACYKQFIDVGKRYRPYKVVPFPQLWDQITRRQETRVYEWLEALADHWERGERELYEQGARALAQELGVPDLGLKILSVEEAFSPPQIEGEIPPPGNPEFTAEIK